MRRLFCLLSALVLLALGAVPATAICTGNLTEEGAVRAAEVVFKGRVLAGRTLEIGGRQVVDGFANMRVLEYRKGDGPDVLRVATASRSQPGGLVLTVSEGIMPAPDEEWVIYGQVEPDGTVSASVCSGSHPSGQPSFDKSAGGKLADLVQNQWGWIVSAAFAAGAVGLAVARVARRRRT
ncbi:MAG: hypothetical protein ACRDZ7_05785 [Acidimicrobiia bacterium]